MSKQIVVIKGISRYEVLRYAADLMAEEWERMGYEVIVVDLCDPGNMYIPTGDNVAFYFSIQGMLLDDESFLPQLHAPYVAWYMDAPIYHSARIRNASLYPDVYQLFVANNYVDYVQRLYNPRGTVRFLPHGGFKASRIVDIKDRTIDIFCPGSYQPSKDTIAEISSLPQVYSQMFYEAVDIMKNSECTSPSQAVMEYFGHIGFEVNGEERLALEPVIQLIDTYYRRLVREQLITQLTAMDRELTVTGNGWDRLDIPGRGNIHETARDGMDIREVTDIIGSSNYCLNSIPCYINGTHERIYTSILNNTKCITPNNEYIGGTLNNRVITFDNRANVNINNTKIISGYETDIFSWEYRARCIINDILGL